MNPSTPFEPIAKSMSPSILVGLRCSRAAGFGFGVFLIPWGMVACWRWPANPTLAIIETFYFVAYGILLVLPWKKIIHERVWHGLFMIFALMSLGFVFMQIFDTLFQHLLAAEFQAKAHPPVIQGVQVFVGLLQMPTLFFAKKPHLLQ